MENGDSRNVAGIGQQRASDRYSCRCELEKVLREGGTAAETFAKNPKAGFAGILSGARSQEGRLCGRWAVITEGHT